jgi:hypothetical protein
MPENKRKAATETPAKAVKEQKKASSTPAIGGVPAPPPKPAVNAGNAAWGEYYKKNGQYVVEYLAAALLECGVDLSEYGELHHIPPTAIKNNMKPAIGGVQMTTFKETWNVERCKLAMESTGKYEAAGSLWWFNLLSGIVTFLGTKISEVEPHRSVVEAALTLWDDAAYRASDLQEHRRRFNFPGVLPTACLGIPDTQQTLTDPKFNGAPTFNNLPLIAGRPCVLAFLESIADCMGPAIGGTGGKDPTRLRKLFEARAS